jgi:SAM-dependent methyltransferase
MLLLYSSAIFVSAVLLFSLEPMVGKMLLPQCGGAAAVWNACMVFYQGVLLLGYAYAHLTTRLLGARRQALLHAAVILLPFAVLPMIFTGRGGPPPFANPTLWLLAQLTVTVGLPFFVVSATAPLLQRWFYATGCPGARDPYFLYSTSNAGSLLALLSYPFLIEPQIGLVNQTHYWTAGYGLLALLILACAAALWLRGRKIADVENLIGDEEASNSRRLTAAENDCLQTPAAVSHLALFRQRLYWLCLAFIPSSLMLGATAHIATDIAAVPLLWIMPLVLYLLSFVIVFARRPPIPHGLMIAAMPIAVLLFPAFYSPFYVKFWIAVPAHLLTFFIVAMVCHGELARSRPDARRLTEFYLWMSVGGVLGGMFNALAAPLLFTWVVEYPLILAAACFFKPAVRDRVKRTEFNRWDVAWLLGLIAAALIMAELSKCPKVQNHYWIAGILYAGPAIFCWCFRNRPLRFALGVSALLLIVFYCVVAQFGNVLLAKRNFYGVKRIRRDADFHCLINGNINHGIQRMHPQPSSEPLGYYHRKGPLGDLACALDQSKPKRRVAVIGLGTGAIAAYARPGQHYTFFEIDPDVIQIARNPRLFTYLRDCRGECDIIEGDARLRIAEAQDNQFDTIILDAFSSDSIPLHLLTREALQLYCRKLKSDGVLVLHISNRYLDLEPVLAALAQNNRLVCFARDAGVSDEEDRNGHYGSHYLVMARRERDLGGLPKKSEWKHPVAPAGLRPWTDDYSNILSALEW